MIRDRVRDEAIAVAKAYSHPQVELRHVLWGLVRVLDDDAPAEVPIATCKAFLEPAGQAWATPTVTAEAEAELATIDDVADAKAAVLDLAKRLGPGGADAAGGAGTSAGPAAPATPGTAGTGTAATTEAATEATPATGPATVVIPETTETILAELDASSGWPRSRSRSGGCSRSTCSMPNGGPRHSPR